jgi:hypothetical protein
VAQLEIPRADAEAGTLPPVCIKCGADATEVDYREFACYPWQTTVLALFQVRYEPELYRVEVGLPFCRRHRHYWLWANTLRFMLPVVLAIPVCLAELVLLLVLLGADIGIPFFVALVTTFVAWLAWNEWCSRRVIRAVRIDAADIVLSPVAPEVVERWQSHVGDDARFGRRGF